jgi:hypothetical protein
VSACTVVNMNDMSDIADVVIVLMSLPTLSAACCCLLLPAACCWLLQVSGPVLDGLRGMSSLLLESEDAGYLLQVWASGAGRAGRACTLDTDCYQGKACSMARGRGPAIVSLCAHTRELAGLL